MKKILLTIIYCLLPFYFLSATIGPLKIVCNDVLQSDVTIIEIADTTLDRISYYNTSFSKPTKLIFTNLTTINGGISFHQTSNLVAVEFPVLETVTGDPEFFEFNNIYFHQNASLEHVDFPVLKSIRGHLYFHQNLSLKTANFPNLETVYSYVYFNGNSTLETLEICNLKEILPQDEFDDPYYTFRDNSETVDAIQPCWGTKPPTTLSLSNNSINENQEPDTLIGDLSATPADQNLTYYFDMNDISNAEGEDYANDLFKITNNQLYSNSSFDFEAKSQYLIKIYVRNSYGEKFGKEFKININDIANEDLDIIEIADTTLDRISYYNTSFSKPTKLIFTNLTTLDGNISFHNTINIKEVEFPLLEIVNGHLFFNRNSSLTVVNFPVLTTINNYLYVSLNNLLTDFNICALIEIVQSQSGVDPYYYIKNNPVLNYDSTCLTNTIISLNYLDNIIEENGKLLIATFNSNAGDDYTIRYFFVDDDGLETTNEDFEIIDNKLYLVKDLSYYQDIEFSLRIGAIRYENTSASKSNNKKVLISGLNERIEETFNVKINGTTLSNDDLTLNHSKLKVYPNPTDRLLNFKNLHLNTIKNIKIYDSTGKMIKSFNSIKDQIDLESLQSGLYFLKINLEDKIISDIILKK